MRFYLSFFKLKFITGLQYRFSAIAGICTQIFFGFVYIMVYNAFYENGGYGGISIESLVSYLWLNQAFFSIVNLYYKDREIINMIKNGNISYELTRPKNLYFMWYCKILGTRLSNVATRFLPVLVLGFILPKEYRLGLPCSIENFILFLVTFILGIILVNAITTLYHVIMMRTLDERGIVGIFITVGDILSGLVVPLPLFPGAFQFIANLFPFRYIGDLPFRIYSGNISFMEGLKSLPIQIIWIIIIVLLGYFLSKKFLKKAIVNGG